MKTIKLKGGFVVKPNSVERADVIIRGGRVEFAAEEDDCNEIIDVTGKYVVPGFVDIHFHGYNLFEFTSGLYDPKSTIFNP